MIISLVFLIVYDFALEFEVRRWIAATKNVCNVHNKHARLERCLSASIITCMSAAHRLHLSTPGRHFDCARKNIKLKFKQQKHEQTWHKEPNVTSYSPQLYKSTPGRHLILTKYKIIITRKIVIKTAMSKV